MPNGMLKDMTNGELNGTRREARRRPVIPRISRGSLVRLPDGRLTVAEMVSDDGKWFRSTGGRAYFTDEAEVVPLGATASAKAA